MAPVVPSDPRLSVVVPTHETRSLTLACLSSVRSEGGDHVELIVVDDASRDGTSEAIRESHPDVRILENERAQGFSRSANRGLAAATGDLLLLLNSDTELLSGAFRALEAAFRDRRSLGVAGAALCYPDRTPQWSGGRVPSLPWLFLLATGQLPLLARLPGFRLVRPVSGAVGGAVDWVTGAAMAFRREVWMGIGELDDTFHFYGQDLDFCTRAREAGWEVAVITGFRVVHHHGATIAGRPEAAGNQSPELLWRDLVRWAWKHRGDSWARWGARALRAGGRLRVSGRALGELFLGREARGRWRSDTLSYRRALRGVREEVRRLEAVGPGRTPRSLSPGSRDSGPS
ncbi:MAG: glycosyltransferase family 2 protein [bacterium]